MPNVHDLTERELREVYPYAVDLADCDVEPLHHIQVIQPHACLLAVERETLIVRQASENLADHTGVPWGRALDASLWSVLGEDLATQVTHALRQESRADRPPLHGYFEVDGRTEARQLLLHPLGECFVVEIEPEQEGFQTAAFQQRLGAAVEAIQTLTGEEAMYQRTAQILRDVSGYDRVMVYRFDGDYNGQVIAEAVDAEREPFLHLRYPASDIPAQARELYLRNRVRILSDVDAVPARIMRSGAVAPDDYLDLSPTAARGLSPIHREYLHNMGVRATMSIAIVVDDRLWGLFAMHHYAGPRYLDYELRSFLRFAGQVFSGHLALQAATAYRNRILEVNVVRSRLGEQIADAQDLAGALTTGNLTVLDVVADVHGAAVSVEGEVHRIGDAPPAEAIAAFANYVAAHDPDPVLFRADAIPGEYPRRDEIAEHSAGILLVWLERERREYIAWFRDERVRHIDWGGNPHKNRVPTADGGTRLAPRASFAKYTELVRGSSEPWTDADVDSALALRTHIKDVVMRRYQSVKRMNVELASAYQEMETFSYTVSHDLRAPLRGISGFAEILLEDYGERLDGDAQGMLTSIRRNVERMNVFIDELLELSRVGLRELDTDMVDVGALAEAMFQQALPGFGDRRIELHVADDLPAACADARLLKVVLGNLVTNAMKYSHNRERAEIRLTADAAPGGMVAYHLTDNGIGIDAPASGQIFEMFTRVDPSDGIEGNGVGLALVKRVIDKHGGEVSVESRLGEGTTFTFTLPAD